MRSLRARTVFAALAGVAFAAGAHGAAAAVGELEEAGTASGPMSIIVGVGPQHTTCFAGGALAGRMVPADEIAPKMRDGQEYRLFDLSGETGEVIAIGGPRHEGGEGECADLWRQDLSLDPRDVGAHRVAVHLPASLAKPLPDPLELMDEPLEEHLELMRDFLARRGIPDPDPEITQAIRTDLDGDGVTDYILNLVRVGEDHARIGDHSIVVMVRGEGDAQRTFIIQEEVDVSDSEYPSTLWVNKIVAVVDIDGDGTAEIITEGGYLYGGGWEVIRWDGNGFEHMLFCGCDG